MAAALTRALLARGRALRPGHWLKTAPVLAPALFGHRFADAGARGAVGATVVAFALAASAGYLVNDVVDRDADRAHPARRLRPIATGEVGPREALGIAAACALAATAVAFAALPRGAGLALGAYGATTLLYTAGLRRVAAVRVACVTAGFVLRVVAGASAAGVTPSPWLLCLTAVLATALGAGKRVSEAREAGAPARGWTIAMHASLAACALGYAAYAASPAVATLHGTRWLPLTAVPVCLALARFVRLVGRERRGRGPADLVLGDPILLGLGAAWVASCALVLA